MSSKKRISYVIPPDDAPLRRLQLPPYGVSRLGSTGPLLIPQSGKSDRFQDRPRHIRHRLGISALVLDSSTRLDGRYSPEGILYSGGRDGLVISWDLGIPMKERTRKEETGRWEEMTGWGDIIEEESEEANDGDILGDVTTSNKRKHKPSQGYPYEQQWETDLEAFNSDQPTTFRQCAQMHNDWINDIILCNYNQTVVSASSDGTIKSWNPHSKQDPSIVGSHADYVRCLTYCRQQNWVASGSFDRTIKLWDLSRSGPSADPLVTLNPFDVANATKSSVYAIATDPLGTYIASGSPERIVRMWDPRSGKRTAKFVGHTDNIRAILVSDDSKYMLTGSADASIKLWSLSSQRCLHTFTHHTESVWSLFSTHPSLEIFYSGDRSGMVCKVDVEECSDVSEGECIVLCRNEDEGINTIVAMDDNLMWTASENSTIKRWKVPQRRSTRSRQMLVEERNAMVESPVSFHHSEISIPSQLQDQEASSSRDGDAARTNTLYGIPFESLVKLVSANDPYTPYQRGKDAEVATLYSAASVMSVPTAPRHSTSITTATYHQHTSPRTEEVPNARMEYEEREIAADAKPLYEVPDGGLEGDHGLVRCVFLNDRVHVLTVDTSGEVGVWDIIRGTCLGVFFKDDVASASMKSGSTASGANGGEKRRSAREALEAVRERIEGEAVVAPWASADTKSGVLTVHLNERCFEAEVYADDIGVTGDSRHPVNEETKINIGKWVLRNLFINFIKEEQRIRKHASVSPNHGESPRSRSRSSVDSTRRHSRTLQPHATSVVSSKTMLRAIPPRIPASDSSRTSPLIAPMIPLNLPTHNASNNNIPLPALPQTPGSDMTPMPIPRRSRSGTLDAITTPLAVPITATKDGDYFTVRTRQTSIADGTQSPMISDEKEPVTTPGGIMGRLKLKNLGKAKRPPSDNIFNSPTVSTPMDPLVTAPSEMEQQDISAPVVKTPLQILLSSPLSPPPSSENPPYHLPSHMMLMITDEDSTTGYRGTVGSTGYDAQVLEEVMPMWLIEYLLMNKTSASPQQVKVSFVLLPWKGRDDIEALPELLNTAQSKLTANRLLRVKKLILHVQDKMDKISNSRAPSIRSSIEDPSPPHSPRTKAEDLYEILCNDVLLPLDMTLASVRQYVWRQSGELVMHYRKKSSPPNSNP